MTVRRECFDEERRVVVDEEGEGTMALDVM